MNKWSQYCIEHTIDDLNSMKETFSNNLIEDAILFIRENYGSPISLDDISQKVNLSSFLLYETLQSKNRTDVVEYLTITGWTSPRICFATNLDLKIKILLNGGYSDYKYFCSGFAAAQGTRPLDTAIISTVRNRCIEATHSGCGKEARNRQSARYTDALSKQQKVTSIDSFNTLLQ